MGACPPGASERRITHGFAAGQPQKHCTQGGSPFPRTPPRGQPLAMQRKAVLWELRGRAMTRSAFLLRVSAPAVLAGSRPLAKEPREKPEPTGRTLGLAREALGHSLQTQRRTLWRWPALDRATGPWRAWAGRRRAQATCKQRGARLPQGDVPMSGTDQWATAT